MTTREQYRGPTLVRWGPVLAGAVIGVALMLLLSTLWVALAEGNDVNAIGRNLHWYAAGSAIVSLFVAGMLAAWLSGVRGTGAGVFHGLTVWGLVLVGSIVFTLPQASQLFQAFTTPLDELGTGPIWATFLSLLVGLIAAGLGGAVGGGMGRPAWLYAHVDDNTAHRPVHADYADARAAGRTDAAAADYTGTRYEDVPADTGTRYDDVPADTGTTRQGRSLRR